MRFPFPRGIYKGFGLHQIDDACRLGWMPLPTYEGTHHAAHAVHAVWLCDCKMTVPRN